MASITKRKGKWLAQVRRKGFAAASRTFSSYTDAKAWAVEQESQLEPIAQQAGSECAAPITLADLFKRYRDAVTTQKRGRETETIRLNCLQRDPIAQLYLAELNHAHLASYRDRRMALVAPATVRRELAIIAHVVETARREWGYRLKSNPVVGVRLPKISNARVRRVSSAEEARLLESLRQSQNKLLLPIAQLAMETGMRRGEILALTWEHIDLTRHIAFLPQTKNGQPRTVPLTPRSVSILLEQKPGKGRVFALSANALRLGWERAVARANIADLRFHDLRHEAISRLFEIGLSVPEVAAVSGHRDVRMLMRYSHMQPLAVARKLAETPWRRPEIVTARKAAG